MPLDPFITTWYLSFLTDQKQRAIFNGTVCEWKIVNEGTSQEFVSGLYLFNVLINDLQIANSTSVHLAKYADDATLVVLISKKNVKSSRAVNEYMDWAYNNCMLCNLAKCNKLIIWKNNTVINYFTLVNDIWCVSSLKILGITFHSGCHLCCW